MIVRRIVWAALALVILTGILLRTSHVYDQHRLTPNERAYLYDAGRLHDEGIRSTRDLFIEYRNDPDLWAVAQPVRIGYVFILDAVMTVMGTTTVEAGMALSYLASVLTLLLVAWLGYRFFNPWVSLIAAAFCATAFTEIWLVRGTPEDGVFGLFGLLELWLTFELMRSPRRFWLYLPFHLIGIWSVLIKQSGVFVYGFCALWLMGFLLVHERSRKQAVVLAASSLGGLLVVCGAYILLAGDASTAWSVYLLSFVSNDEGWSYNKECCFGPWTQIPRVLLLLSPLTFFLALAGIAVLIYPWKIYPGKTASLLTPIQRSCGGVCALMAFGFVAMFSFVQGMEVLRFITPGQGAVCLVAAIGLWSLMSLAQRNLSRLEYRGLVALVAAGFMISMVRDYGVFNKVAMQAQIPELGAALIRSALGL
jgi:hypothetical protein